MPFQFVAPELAKWDALVATPDGPPELLVAPFFSDERPLRGAAGLCDWRMCGRLSRLILAERITGDRGEVTLLPGRRLAFPKLLLFGMGASDEFAEPVFRWVAREIAKVMRRLGVRRYAVPLPGRSTGRIAARRALELWVEEVEDDGEVWLVESPSTQKDLAEVLGRRSR